MIPVSFSDPDVITAACSTLGVGWLTTYGTRDTFVAIRDGNGKYLGAVQESVNPNTGYHYVGYALCS